MAKVENAAARARRVRAEVKHVEASLARWAMFLCDSFLAGDVTRDGIARRVKAMGDDVAAAADGIQRWHAIIVRGGSVMRGQYLLRERTRAR